MFVSRAARLICSSLTSLSSLLASRICPRARSARSQVPYCGLATVEQLSGEKTDVTDQFELTMLRFFGGQDLQPAQKELIDGIAKELVPKVKKI